MSGWVTPDAPTHAELSSCVQCGLCLPGCPTFRLTGDEAASPRGRLTAMSLVGAGEAELDETFEELMGFCLQCRACESACPSLVPFGRAMEGARAEITAQRPSATRRARAAMLGPRILGSRRVISMVTALAAVGQRLRVRRLLPGRLARGFSGLRSLPFRPPSTRGTEWEPIGRHHGTAAFLAGCVMESWFSPVHHASITALRRAGFRVEVPAAQRCCGALAAHDGAADQARALAAVNEAAFREYELIVTDSAGCGAHLKEYRHWAPDSSDWSGRVRDITEVVAEAIADDRLPTFPSTGELVAMQDPCHLRHAQRVIDPPRAIVKAAGYLPVEIDPLALCCGAAGVYSLLRPDTSARLGIEKADQVRATAARIVASANPGCEMQLRTHLGHEYRVAHPVELFVESLIR